MKKLFLLRSPRPSSIAGIVISLIIAASVSIAQAVLPAPEKAPKEVIEELWSMAVRGGLLTSKGWNRAGDYFTDPTPWTTNMTVVVMSNDYGFDESSISGGTAKAVMMCTELGQIDANLRYTPLPGSCPSSHADLRPRHRETPRKSERKRDILESQRLSPGNPWTTVNTAIRYVLQMREKAADPAIKKNANQPIAKLLRLN